MHATKKIELNQTTIPSMQRKKQPFYTKDLSTNNHSIHVKQTTKALSHTSTIHYSNQTPQYYGQSQTITSTHYPNYYSNHIKQIKKLFISLIITHFIPKSLIRPNLFITKQFSQNYNKNRTNKKTLPPWHGHSPMPQTIH